MNEFIDDSDAISYCQSFPEALTEWEIDFLDSIDEWLVSAYHRPHFSAELTVRQAEVLEKIVIKCRKYEKTSRGIIF